MEKIFGRKEFIIMTSAKDFIKDFDKLYKNDRTSIFKLFQEGGFNLSEQNEIFSKLSNKNKCKLYSTISVESREKYLAYLVYTENNDYTVDGFNKFLSDLNDTTNDAKLSTMISNLDSESNVRKLLSSIRSQAVADALVIEQNLLDGGMCTRDWSIEQIKNISSTKQTPIPMNFESSVWEFHIFKPKF